MNNKLVCLISLLILVQSFQSVVSCPGSFNGISIVHDEDCTNGRRSLGCNAGYIYFQLFGIEEILTKF
jgi:hypothetical protein